MKNNTYFEELNRTARAFEEKHEAHKKLKQQIIDTQGWDSEELKAWYKKEEEDFRYPISDGACKAYRAWRYAVVSLQGHIIKGIEADTQSSGRIAEA